MGLDKNSFLHLIMYTFIPIRATLCKDFTRINLLCPLRRGEFVAEYSLETIAQFSKNVHRIGWRSHATIE